MVFPEVGNRVVIRPQVARQPHHLDIDRAGPLQLATAADAVQLAIQVYLQQEFRTTSTGSVGLHGLKAKP